MIDLEKLRVKTQEWVGEPKNGEPFMRPYFCRGDARKGKIFLVGINPATPIKPEHGVTAKALAASLHADDNGKSFYDIYDKVREEKTGKTKKSKTRNVLIEKAEELEKLSGYAVVETNVSAYPCQKTSDIKGRGYEVFEQVVNFFQPKLMIFHGGKAIKQLNKIYGTKFPEKIGDITSRNCLECVEGRWIAVAPHFSRGHYKDIYQIVKKRIKEKVFKA